MSDDEPIAKRRTPRRSIAPNRLGLDDDWAEAPAGKWTPGKEGKTPKSQRRSKSPDRKSPEEEAVAQQAVAAEAPAPAPAQTEGGDSATHVSSMIEGFVLSAAGDFINQTYFTGSENSLVWSRIGTFGLWGAIVTLFVAPYTNWITSFKLANNTLIDGALKSIVNQFLLNVVLTALFIVFNSLMTVAIEGKAYPNPEQLLNTVTTNFNYRWTETAKFWLAADTLNLILIPADFQMLYGSIASMAWGIFHSHLNFIHT